MESLEVRLGYQFKNRQLLLTALTLPSMANERKLSGKGYQRLEFLGDGVVDLVVSERLYEMFPEDDEGALSKLWTRAVKTETARTIAAMMRTAVESGTGTAARIPGFVVGGKTGTAETGVAGTNTTWFISFAGKDRPEVAVAVVVEQQNSTGGQTAAPVAREVLQAILGTTANP